MYFIRVTLLVCVLLQLVVGSSYADTVVQPDQETDTEMGDAYYNAMLRSINLDRSRWKAFSNSINSGPWFYDTKSIRKKSGRVSAEVTVYPNPHRTELYSSIYSDHVKIRRIVMGTEIDCTAKRYRQTHLQAFGYDEQVLSDYTYKLSEQKFVPIKSATMNDTLRGIVCGGGRKPRK
jgi:hypothetical protein